MKVPDKTQNVCCIAGFKTHGDEIPLPPLSLSLQHLIATKKNTTKFGNGFIYIFSRSWKRKTKFFPQFFSSSFLFSLPQNYNVQIHKCMRCFFTLEINMAFAGNAAAGLLRRWSSWRSGFWSQLLSVHLSGFI